MNSPRRINTAICAGIISVVLALSGCVSQAGPFVRDIQADANGNLIIEKCMVEHTDFLEFGQVETGKCRSFILPLSKVTAKTAAQQPAAEEVKPPKDTPVIPATESAPPQKAP